MSQAPPPINPTPPEDQGLDAAQQSLSDALRVSFNLLKGLMVLLGIVYIFSGVFRVEENELGVRYRFGERVDTHQQGWHFGWPFPIDDVKTVPLNAQIVKLDKAFWYHNPEDKSPEELAGRLLNPLEDSFLITGDGNVVHVQFDIEYVIKESAVEDYLRNVGSEEKAKELVRTAAERGMIHSIASRNIEQIITKSEFPRSDIKFRTQQVLDNLASGITVEKVLIAIENQSMPTQVREAYNGVTQAQADKVRTIQEARRSFDETLGQTAGGSHTELLLLVRAYEAALASEQDELAKSLRVVLNRSIADLRLPEQAQLEAVRAYLDVVAGATASTDPQVQARAAQSASTLKASLASLEDKELSGKAITGEISALINKAKSNRIDIANKASRDYSLYASALNAFNKAPLVLANDRLQATREKVMGGLVQTIIGPVTRIETNPDPEVQEEIAKDELEKRKLKAREAKENE